MLVVTDQEEITKCQKLFEKALYKQLTLSETLRIGHTGESFFRKVRYNDDIWFSTYRNTDAAVPRYWNAFGLGKREGGTQNIVVQINPPIKGYTKQLSGLFARDVRTGDYALLHTGRIGGGRKGIGKKAFVDWFRGAWMEVSTPDGRTNEAILVSLLKSPKIVNQILRFVHEVARFKEEASLGLVTRSPYEQSRGREFSPEFYGNKKGHRSGVLEYESFHGLVVNSLEERVRLSLGDVDANIFNTRAIDLGVEIGNKLAQIYEVKSSADQKSIYTAVGQLMLHSAGDLKATKTIVIPSGQLESLIRKILERLGIVVLEYRIADGKVQFSK